MPSVPYIQQRSQSGTARLQNPSLEERRPTPSMDIPKRQDYLDVWLLTTQAASRPKTCEIY